METQRTYRSTENRLPVTNTSISNKGSFVSRYYTDDWTGIEKDLIKREME